MNKNTHGGYRPGSGRAKTGYYKGIYCGSTYELAWVVYQLDHNLEFSRFETCLIHPVTGKKYFPDFIQDGKIIEIKGYESIESVNIKTEIAELNGYSVCVKRKQDLQNEFQWLKEKYNLSKDYYHLYDGYKPQYSYSCSYCGNLFSRDKPIKTTGKFCSRKCGGAGHTGWHPGRNQYSKLREAAGVAVSPSN